MAIIVYSLKLDGFGDVMFGLKMIKRLKQMLNREDIILMTGEEEAKAIKELKADKEFGVDVQLVDDVAKQLHSEQLKVEELFVGYVFKQNMFDKIQFQLDTPITLIPEYSADPIGLGYLNIVESTLSRKKYGRYRNVEVLYGGVGSFIFEGSEDVVKEAGILATQELVDAAKVMAGQDVKAKNDLRQHAWKDFRNTGFAAKLLGRLGQESLDEYDRTTNLNFEYCSGSNDIFGRPGGNSCLHFLRVLQKAMLHEATMNSNRNQDVIGIGSNVLLKLEGLKAIKDKLINENKFNKIVFIGEDGNEQVLHDDKRPNQKVFRLIHARSLPHQQMISLQLLSGDLVGATGNESMIESLGKLIVYETRAHRRKFKDSYLQAVNEFVRQKQYDPNVAILARLLIEAKSDSEYDELPKLLNNPIIVGQLKAINILIAEERDLGLVIVKKYYTRKLRQYDKADRKEKTEMLHELRGDKGFQEKIQNYYDNKIKEFKVGNELVQAEIIKTFIDDTIFQEKLSSAFGKDFLDIQFQIMLKNPEAALIIYSSYPAVKLPDHLHKPVLEKMIPAATEYEDFALNMLKNRAVMEHFHRLLGGKVVAEIFAQYINCASNILDKNIRWINHATIMSIFKDAAMNDSKFASELLKNEQRGGQFFNCMKTQYQFSSVDIVDEIKRSAEMGIIRATQEMEAEQARQSVARRPGDASGAGQASASQAATNHERQLLRTTKDKPPRI